MGPSSAPIHALLGRALVAFKELLKIGVRDPPPLADIDGAQVAQFDPVPHGRLGNLQAIGHFSDGLIRVVRHHEVADARLLLADLARSLKDMDGVSCSTEVLLDDPFAGITRAVADAAPDLLVIGPHRRQILRDAFVGTTAERTIRAVSCPVLMVNGPPVGRWRHVLLTTDLSDNSARALRRFAGLHLGSRAQVSVLSVFEAPALRLVMSDSIGKGGQEDYLQDLRLQAGQQLAAFLAEVDIGPADRILRHDETTVAREILNAADKLKADLVVVSTQGKGAVTRLLIGSVAQQVLRDATVDVLAVPPDAAG
jgi:nucleotide-binding universal stress UspA family protein